MNLLQKNYRVFIAGHNGMVGSSLVKAFKKNDYYYILTVGKKELDLTDKNKVDNYQSDKKITTQNTQINTESEILDTDNNNLDSQKENITSVDEASNSETKDNNEITKKEV